MFFTQKKIMEVSGLSRSSVYRLKKLIEAHPERYGKYGVSGRLICFEAVIDAEKFKWHFEMGFEDKLPEFKIEDFSRYMGDVA